jgi:hypothetical protein
MGSGVFFVIRAEMLQAGLVTCCSHALARSSSNFKIQTRSLVREGAHINPQMPGSNKNLFMGSQMGAWHHNRLADSLLTTATLNSWTIGPRYTAPAPTSQRTSLPLLLVLSLTVKQQVHRALPQQRFCNVSCLCSCYFPTDLHTSIYSQNIFTNKLFPRGGGLQYLHRRPASRKMRQKGNPVPVDITGPFCSCGI